MIVNEQLSELQRFDAVTRTVVVPKLNTEPLPFPLPLLEVAPLNVYVIVGVGVPDTVDV